MNTSKKIIAGVLILAVALSGCYYDPGTGAMTVTPACSSNTTSSAFRTTWLDWQSVAFLAASTVFVVSILIYMLGYAIHHDKAIIWAKEQMQEAILAMVITIFVIGLVSFFCSINMSTLGLGAGPSSGLGCFGTVPVVGPLFPPTYDMSDAAFCYLSSVYGSIMQGYMLVIAMNSIFSAAATMTIGFAPGGVGIILSPFAFLADVSNSLLLATIALMTGAVLTLAQMALLRISAALFVILFPVGVILRSFGATRGFGGGLIAIALGFFLMYPLLAVLFYGAVSGDISSNYSGLSSSFQNAGLSPTDTNWFGGGIIGLLAGFVGRAVMGAIIIPLIMFMVLIAFVKGLSIALGEEVDVSNLTRLI